MRAMILAFALLWVAGTSASAATSENRRDKDYEGADAGYLVLSATRHTLDTGGYTIVLGYRKADRSMFGFVHTGPDGGWFAANPDIEEPADEGDVLVRALEPGDYELYYFGSATGYGVIRVSYSIPFHIAAKATTYLGEFRSAVKPRILEDILKDRTFIGGIFFSISNQSIRDLPIAAKKKLPPLGEVTIAVPDMASLRAPLFNAKPDLKPSSGETMTAFSEGIGADREAIGRKQLPTAERIRNLTKAIDAGDLWVYAQAEAFNMRAILRLEEKNIDAAIADFTRAIAIDRYSSTGYSNRGIAYRLRGAYDAALADQNKALDFYPDSPRLLTNRARTYAAMGHYDEALADLNDTVDLIPEDPDAYVNRAQVYAAMGQRDRAIADYSQAIRIKRTDEIVVDWYRARGYLYLLNNEPQKAYDDFDKLIYRRLAGAEDYNGRCTAMIVMAKLKEAMRDCDKAIATKADYAIAHDTRGQLHFLLNQYQDAIKDFDAAIKGNAKLATSLYGRGAAKIKTGNVESGVADLNAALAINSRIAERMAKLGVAP